VWEGTFFKKFLPTKFKIDNLSTEELKKRARPHWETRPIGMFMAAAGPPADGCFISPAQSGKYRDK